MTYFSTWELSSGHCVAKLRRRGIPIESNNSRGKTWQKAICGACPAIVSRTQPTYSVLSKLLHEKRSFRCGALKAKKEDDFCQRTKLLSKEIGVNSKFPV